MSTEIQRNAAPIGHGQISVPYIREQQLKAKLRSLREMGIIQPGYRLEHVAGRTIAHVAYLKPLPSPGRRRTHLALLAAGALSGLVWLVWESRYVIGAVLLAAVALLVLAGAAVLLRSNHRAVCPGLHCAGCKG